MLSASVGVVGTATVLVLVRWGRRAQATDRATALAPASTHVPAWLDRRLADALVSADIRCNAAVALQGWALAALVAVALGSVFSLVFGALAGLAVIVGGPIALWGARGRGRRRAASAVPGALELCAMELRGGGTIATAIDALAAHEGPLAVDFGRVRDRFGLGASLDDAIGRWAEERDAPGVRAAAGALALGASVGGACADALEGLAASLRARLAVMAEARALSAQARLSAIVVGASPVAYLGWSALIDPGPLASLVGSMAGRVCVSVAISLEVLALVWMRRVLREEAAWS